MQCLYPFSQKIQSFILVGIYFREDSKYPRLQHIGILLILSGNITAKYRKIHLFDARIGDKIVREADCFLAGDGRSTVKVGEFKVGLSICYDLRFPDLYQHYARKGAEILTVPSCFTRKTGEAHWEALLRARAIENLVVCFGA